MFHKMNLFRNDLENSSLNSFYYLKRFFITYDFLDTLRSRIVNPFIIPKLLTPFNFSNNIDFSVYFRFSNTFKLINFNILKNIFLRTLNDNPIWSELNKMLVCGVLGFSHKFIYQKDTFLKSSLLSIFLFEIYFLEVDEYISNLCFQYNTITSFICKDLSSSLVKSKNLEFFYLPLTLEKSLQRFHAVLGLDKNHFINLRGRFSYYSQNRKKIFFSRQIQFIRYKDHVILLITGSKDFAYLIYNKCTFFLRSSLSIDSMVSKVSFFKDKNIYFLGFNILLKNFNARDTSSCNLVSNILSRLYFIKRKLVDFSLKRVYHELIVLILRLLPNHISKFNKYINQGFWINLFQLESLRFYNLQNYNLSGYDFTMPYSQVKFLKFFSSIDFSFRKYSFNYYLHKYNKTLSIVINSYPNFIGNSLYSLDSKFYIYLIELKKKLFLSYSTSSYNFGEFIFSTSPNLKLYYLPVPVYNNKYIRVCLLAPLPYLYSRLRSLGFIHFDRFRPVGNPKLLFLSDYYIIKEFGFFSLQIMFWYRLSFNFYKLKLLVEFLRQSCILTLCRKHNKSKSWITKVYSSKLLIAKNLFNFDSFFPSKKYLLGVKRNFNLRNLKYWFSLSEKFFLDN